MKFFNCSFKPPDSAAYPILGAVNEAMLEMTNDGTSRERMSEYIRKVFDKYGLTGSLISSSFTPTQDKLAQAYTIAAWILVTNMHSLMSDGNPEFAIISITGMWYEPANTIVFDEAYSVVEMM